MKRAKQRYGQYHGALADPTKLARFALACSRADAGASAMRRSFADVTNAMTLVKIHFNLGRAERQAFGLPTP